MRIMINLMDRVMKGEDTNVTMDHPHEVGEEDPNRVVGEEEAADEIGKEEGTGTGGIDLGILVGQREAVGEVVLDGVNGHGHEKSPQLRIFVGGCSTVGRRT